MAPYTMPLTVASFAFIQPTQRLMIQHRPTSAPHIQSIISHPYAVPTDHNSGIEYSSLSSSPAAAAEGDDIFSSSTTDSSQRRFTQLCNDLKVGPTPGLLRLETNNDTGIRGLYPNVNLKEGDIILSIPLSSCLRDDEPPSWLKLSSADDDALQWPTRLAASLVDLQLRTRGREKDDNDNNEKKGKSIWLDMLPDPNLLRASLPLHWSEDILSSTKSVQLEMAVDMVYFARANAIPDLITSIQKQQQQRQEESDLKDVVKDLTEKGLERLFQDAFDVVQTRCCAVNHPSTFTDADVVLDDDDEDDDGGRTTTRRLRLVAPVFDFLNHGTGCFPHPGSPNAIYESTTIGNNNNDDNKDGNGDDGGKKEPLLVVRATKDIRKHEEIFVDYGESAHTAWKCLGSYGFVPHYDIEDDERSTAELYVDGVRTEVGGDNVPFELIEAASNALNVEMDENNPLSPAIALRIAERAFDFADELLQEEEEGVVTGENEEELYSLSLASSLRLYQSKVLRNWAFGLKQFAADQCMEQY